MNALAIAFEAGREVPARRDPWIVRAKTEAHSPGLANAVLAAVDGLAHGIAIFDAAGDLQYANTEGHAVLVRWQSGAAHRASESQQRWQQVLLRVCRLGLRELFEFTAGDTLHYAALAPLPVEGRSCAFVTFSRDELCGSVELQMFCTRHGLTPAETQVLRQLCRGLRAHQIARAHGVSDSTVVTQIAAIRNKTLHSSVQSLLGALSKMPPFHAAPAMCR